MDTRDEPALREFAREHRVHYDVTPEEDVRADRREVVGFEVRLFAAHEAAPLEAPACPTCVALLDELRAFAGAVVQGGAGAPAAVELVAEPAALYESDEDRDVDEVALTIRIGPSAPEAPGAARAALDGLRERLGALGVAQR